MSTQPTNRETSPRQTGVVTQRPERATVTHEDSEVVIGLTDEAGSDSAIRLALTPETALGLAYALRREVAVLAEEHDLDPVAVIAAVRGTSSAEAATDIVAGTPDLVRAVLEADDEAARGEFLTLEEAFAEECTA